MRLSAPAAALLFLLPAAPSPAQAPSAVQECNYLVVTDDAHAIIFMLQRGCRPGDKVLLHDLPEGAAAVVAANSCAFDRQIVVVPRRKPVFGRVIVDVACIYPRAPR
jgi:hypothetical protein